MNTKHVPSLELCQEFDTLCKEKGIVVPETECWWYTVENDLNEEEACIDEPDRIELYGIPVTSSCPAPLVSELGEFLPARIVLETKLLKKEESVILYYIKYEDDASDCDGTNLEDCVKTKWVVECGKEIIRETTEANARMKCLLYLLENDIIDGNAFN